MIILSLSTVLLGVLEMTILLLITKQFGKIGKKTSFTTCEYRCLKVASEMAKRAYVPVKENDDKTRVNSDQYVQM